MNEKYNISSSPHTRSSLSTKSIMRDVIISLVPVSVVGVLHFGFYSLLVLLVSIAAAVGTEFVFDLIAKKGDTWKDGSAVVTGLLLGLVLPPRISLLAPVLGSVFAILFVKCFFGGLGKNFMNPALAGRCFLLISFGGAMTKYSYTDAVSSATPLAALADGQSVKISEMLLGFGTVTGVIGCSALALIIGGIYLLIRKVITWEIPVSCLVVFTLFVGIFGGKGFDPEFLFIHILGGGVIMGSFFMATDPVTSPMTKTGHLIYGSLVGLLCGVFRIFGTAADSVSYAIIISNLVTPLIDEYVVPLPYGLQKGAKNEKGEGATFSAKMFEPALRLFIITLLAGIGLAGVYNMTKDTISEQQEDKKLASYQEVLPDAAELTYDDDITKKVEAVSGENYGTDFGKIRINEAITGRDGSGEIIGYVVSVTTGDGYDGDITLSIGVMIDGTINRIAFTELHESAGMGMKCGDPEFKDQFNGRNVSRFTLNKAGGSKAEDEIDSVSGASISSGAVVNAVNAALDFLHSNVL